MKLGGPAKFYKNFYLSATFPGCLTKNGKNCNYYDDSSLLRALGPDLRRSLTSQSSWGSVRRSVIVIGTGRNLEIVQKLNAELQLYDSIVALEHPRFVMQYRFADAESYRQRYIETLQSSLEWD